MLTADSYPPLPPTLERRQRRSSRQHMPFERGADRFEPGAHTFEPRADRFGTAARPARAARKCGFDFLELALAAVVVGALGPTARLGDRFEPRADTFESGADAFEPGADTFEPGADTF